MTDPGIQSLMMKIAIKEENLEEAKRIATKKRFANDPVIQSQLMTIMSLEGNFEEAERIGNKETLKNIPEIQSQMLNIRNRKESLKRKREKESEMDFKESVKAEVSEKDAIIKLQEDKNNELINLNQEEHE